MYFKREAIPTLPVVGEISNIQSQSVRPSSSAPFLKQGEEPHHSRLEWWRFPAHVLLPPSAKGVWKRRGLGLGKGIFLRGVYALLYLELEAIMIIFEKKKIEGEGGNRNSIAFAIIGSVSTP